MVKQWMDKIRNIAVLITFFRVLHSCMKKYLAKFFHLKESNIKFYTVSARNFYSCIPGTEPLMFIAEKRRVSFLY